MATHFKPWEGDGRYGTHYRFDKAGDGIAMHAHMRPELRHSVLCLAGTVEIYGDGIDTAIAASQEYAFPSFRLHEIAALEDGTEIVNVFVTGKPEGYEGLDAPGMTGSVECLLMGRMEFST